MPMRWLKYSRPPAGGLQGPRLWGAWLLLAAVFFLTAELGLLLAVPPANASPVWPAAGLGVAALLRFGRRLWPGIWVGEFLAVLDHDLPLGAMFAMASGNALEALVAASLLVHFGGGARFLTQPRHLVVFLGAATLLAPLLGAGLSMLGLWAAGRLASSDLGAAGLIWWLGDAIGILVVTPLLVAWTAPRALDAPRLGFQPQPGLILGAALVLSLVLVNDWLPDRGPEPLLFLLLPLLVWGAFQLSQRGLTALILLLSLSLLAYTLPGIGPLAAIQRLDALLLLQASLGVMAATSLVLSAILGERGRILAQLRQYQADLERRVAEATHNLREVNLQLEEEHLFMRAVQDTVPTLLVVLDRRGGILTFNRACQALTGFTEDEALGRTPWDLFVPPEQAAGVREVFRTLSAGRFPNEHENDLLTRAGERRRVEWRNTVILDPQGEVRYVIGTGLDVTERRQAEAALRQSAAEWSHAMEYFDDALCITDPQGRLARANRAFYALLGLSAEVALGQDILGLLCPREREGDACTLAHLLRDGQGGTLTLEAEDPHNPTRSPIEVSVEPLGEARDTPRGLLVALHDLRHARQTEAELQRLSAHVRLLLESTGEGIYGLDRDRRCTFVNQAGAELLGYRVEQLVGQDVHGVLLHSREDGSPYPFSECPIHQTLTRGEPVRSDNDVLWHRDGWSIPVQYTANPIHAHGQVSGAVVVFRDVAESRALAQHMDYLANHDPLTGLFNRYVFERHLERAIQEARQEDRQHVLCYLDLDQFKVVNDTCGHTAGDELLRQLAPLLRARIRRGDTLARLGGDEFGVLLESCTVPEATPVVEGILRTIRDYRFAWEGKNFALGVSIGVVPIDRHTEGPAAVLSAADSACYVAKDQGRNRLHVFREEDSELTRRHGEMQWVARLHAALAEERFLLYCQPILRLNQEEGEGCHLEILLRLRDETGQITPPGAFIPAAERYNLMPALDRWVLERTLGWFQAHRDCLERLDLCCINLSGHTLGDPEFAQTVIHLTQSLGIPPHKICFEITETAAVANLSNATRFMGDLRAHGFRFALDDFGSGMSSFAYLKNLPVDFLKIDGNFVRDIAEDRIDYAMVTAINQVGQVMGLRTIAEFVENDAILARLRQIGVDYGQGYGIAPTLPLAELDCAHQGTSRDLAA